MKRLLIILSSVALSAFALSAQDAANQEPEAPVSGKTIIGYEESVSYTPVKHEFSLYGKGGLSTLLYSIDKDDRDRSGSVKKGLGGTVGLGYVYFFNPNWGIQTGVELAIYNSTANFADSLRMKYTVLDSPEDFYKQYFSSAFSKHVEAQRSMYLQIPIMVQYQTNGRHRFYAAAGVKAAISLGAKYDISAEVDNMLYSESIWETDDGYSGWTSEEFYIGNGEDNPEEDYYKEAYFVGYKLPYEKSGKSSLNFNLLGSVEAGMKWGLSTNWSLYTGLYADLGILSAKTKNVFDKEHTMSWSHPRYSEDGDMAISAVAGDANPTEGSGDGYTYDVKSVLESEFSSATIRPFAAGIKVGVAFGPRRQVVNKTPIYYTEPEPVPVPVYDPQLAYLAPVPEPVKVREESGSAYIDFRVNQTVIDFDYRNNRAEIGSIQATIDEVKNNKFASISEVRIKGFASPEGGYANNTRLARERVAALAQFLKGHGVFDGVAFSTQYEPEDWAGFEKAIIASDLEEKDQVLELIRDTTIDDQDTREKKIQQIGDGSTYKFILENIYPALRRTDYTVEFVVRSFTLEESKEVLKTDPRQLSLDEMYRVAQTYEPGSEEFNEVFETAVRVFPNDPVSNLNAANIALVRKDAVAARAYLDKAQACAEKDLAETAYSQLVEYLELTK